MRLRSYLILIVFGTLLPVLVLTAVLIVLYHTQMRRATEVRFEDPRLRPGTTLSDSFDYEISDGRGQRHGNGHAPSMT